MSSKTEVGAKRERRIFTAADKARIIAEHEKAASPTERAAVLRREGVYTSHRAMR